MKRKHLVTITVIIVALIATIGWFTYKQHHTYTANVESQKMLDSKLRQNAVKQKFTYLFVFSNKCKVCRHIESQLSPEVNHKDDIIVLNKESLNSKDYYLANNQIMHTPTLVLMYQGDVIYQYSGGDINKFKLLLAKKDPFKKTNFKMKTPISSKFYDAYSKTMSRQITFTNNSIHDNETLRR